MTRKLNGPNHTAWAADTRERLQRLGLWDAVAEEEALTDMDVASSLRLSTSSRRQAERANRLIIDSLEPYVLRDLLLTALPSNLWSVLEIKYRDQAFGCVLEKTFEYFDARVDDPEMSIDDHVVSMQARVDTLATMGFAVSEGMQAMVLLRSLRGSRFAPFLKEARQLPQTSTLASIVDQLKRFSVGTAPDKDTKTTVEDETESTAGSETPWGSMSMSSTMSFASHEVSEEVMNAFARAVHSPSLESSGSQSSISSATTQPSTSCWCTHKHHHVS